MYKKNLFTTKHSPINLLLIILIMSLIIAGCSSEESAQKSSFGTNVEISEDIIVFPAPDSIILIEIDTLDELLPGSKEDGSLPVTINFSTEEASFKTYGKIKVQGTSTQLWAKKNWSLDFYADKERTEALRLKIGDSVPSNKWIAKAEWIDPTILRNGLSYRLWEAMVKSRDCLPQYEVENALADAGKTLNELESGAQGFPKSYPAQIYVNDDFYGLSMLLLGHDPQNFNIDIDNPNHLYMEFDARYGSSGHKTWAKLSSIEIGECIDGYFPKSEDFSDEHKAAIDSIGEFINSPLDEFKANFDKHLDRTNIIDMLLFIEAIYDWDALALDIEMVTYDLEKWYLLPWDKDTTFGLFWDGSGLIENSETMLAINYSEEWYEHLPWYKTYHAFTPEVESRYAQLRDSGIFSVSGLSQLMEEMTQHFTESLLMTERFRWVEAERPSVDETSPEQIIQWFEKRLELLDKHFNYS